MDADPRSLLDLDEASGDEDVFARAKPLYEQVIDGPRDAPTGRLGCVFPRLQGPRRRPRLRHPALSARHEGADVQRLAVAASSNR